MRAGHACVCVFVHMSVCVSSFVIVVGDLVNSVARSIADESYECLVLGG